MTSQDRLHWRTSSYSGTNGGQCVQVAFEGPVVYIRDSKYLKDPANDPADQPVISFDIDFWPRFLDQVIAEVNHVADDLPKIEHRAGNGVILRGPATDSPSLAFTHREWAAFIAGVHAHEFDLAAV